MNEYRIVRSRIGDPNKSVGFMSLDSTAKLEDILLKVKMNFWKPGLHVEVEEVDKNKMIGFVTREGEISKGHTK